MDRPSHGLVTTGILIAALAGAWLWLAMLSGPWNVASGLLDARAHLDRAEKALARGGIKEARYETLSASAAARRAAAGYRSAGPMMDLLRVLPRIGPILEETEHLVDAARFSAEAARGTLSIAEGALRGRNKIIERQPDGNARLRLERIEEIGGTITEVRSSIRATLRALQAVDTKRLPRRLRRQVTQGIDRARETDTLLADAEAGFAILPGFLGASERRNYLIAMQNPSEQRGTGGSILQFTRMTIDEGVPRLPKEKNLAQSVYNVDRDRIRYDIPLPEDAWYVRLVPDARRFGNANWSPHWPLSADLLSRYARAADPTFPEMDGVIAVDPITLKNLMPGVGQFRTSRGNVISAKRAVPFLLNRSYGAFGAKEAVRRAVLRSVVDRFYEGMIKPKRPTNLVEGLGKSLTEKHMQIWLRRPNEQAFIERMDWDAGLDPAEGSDYLNVVEQNVGGNKLDYFQTQEHALDVFFDGNDVLGSLEVAVTNGTLLPQPRYVMGDSGGRRHGLTRPMMNVYVPASTTLLGATVDGRRVALGESTSATWGGAPARPPERLEVGKKVWPIALEIPVGETQSFRYDYRVPDVVRRSGSRRVYRLVLQHQPKINPERMVVRISLPEGAGDVRARGFRRRGRALVWDRTITRDLVLEVSWRA